MTELNNQERVDQLIQHFWKNGYLTVKRKYGTYLPEPTRVGTYDVDAIGKQRKKYAIGINLSEEELNDPQIVDKLNFLATRNTKYTQKKVLLFVGVAREFRDKAKLIIARLDTEVRKNIKLAVIPEGNLN